MGLKKKKKKAVRWSFLKKKERKRKKKTKQSDINDLTVISYKNGFHKFDFFTKVLYKVLFTILSLQFIFHNLKTHPLLFSVLSLNF